VLNRSRSGVVTSSWALAEAGRRNEALDTMNYAEAAARRKGWTALTDDQWNALADERGAAPAEGQGDLFDAAVTVVAEAAQTDAPQKAAEKKTPARPERDDAWIKPRTDWI
uniref:hypothetical protein n=1 Tax=Novosphingobium sp. TaxID=1874826 RepID=UPI00261541F0